MSKPDTIITLVEYALEHCPEAQSRSSMAEAVERTALDGIQGIGATLFNAALGCGKLDCTPQMEQLPDTEPLVYLGELIEELAKIAKLCSEHRDSQS